MNIETRVGKLEKIHKAKATTSVDNEKVKAWLENIIQAIIDDHNQQIASHESFNNKACKS